MTQCTCTRMTDNENRRISSPFGGLQPAEAAAYAAGGRQTTILKVWSHIIILPPLNIDVYLVEESWLPQQDDDDE